GSPGTSMPPWKNVLTEEQIWQIVAFIRTLK
ncbi:MAG: cytochrome c, partial [Anaerolineales bacterium]|nr:cytochrome c [Anaerolineales bacterium]